MNESSVSLFLMQQNATISLKSHNDLYGGLTQNLTVDVFGCSTRNTDFPLPVSLSVMISYFQSIKAAQNCRER